jgi:hypothetical protein
VGSGKEDLASTGTGRWMLARGPTPTYSRRTARNGRREVGGVLGSTRPPSKSFLPRRFI